VSSDHGGMGKVKTLVDKRFGINEVLPYAHWKRKGEDPPRKTFGGYVVKMDSLRYQVFKKSLECSWCGIKGEFFLLQANDNYLWRREARQKGYFMGHFNLYAEERGKLVLMTKDHVIPKAHGGRDTLRNMQTMCSSCNEIKGARREILKKDDEDVFGITWFPGKQFLFPDLSVRMLLTAARSKSDVAQALIDYMLMYDKYGKGDPLRKWMYDNSSLLTALVEFHK